MSQNIPQNVKKILTILNDNGYEGYIVGGAVRDYIMGEQPHDWDIATNAKPEQVKSLFHRTIDTGIKHGTITAMLKGEGYEITTYRCDGFYSDGRHPDSIEFVSRIEDDLARRDFTINAMAMDVDGNIVDPYGGLEDIKNGVIRCVGNPDDRFSEDALRMMRALRFESKLAFELDPATRDAISRNADKIQRVSAERIHNELTKMLVSKMPKKGFIDAYETGITKYILPEFDRMMQCEQDASYHYATVGIHTLDAVENIKPDLHLRWTMFLHDVGKPDAKDSKEVADKIMRRLHFTNRDRFRIDSLIENHDLILSKPNEIRKFAALCGSKYIDSLCAVKVADIKAHSSSCRDSMMREHMGFIDKCRGYLVDGTAIKKSDLKVNSYRLQDCGLKGEAIGKFLTQAYEVCLVEPELNNRETLMKMAKERVEEIKSNYENNLDNMQLTIEEKGMVSNDDIETDLEV